MVGLTLEDHGVAGDDGDGVVDDRDTLFARWYLIQSVKRVEMVKVGGRGDNRRR